MIDFKKKIFYINYKYKNKGKNWKLFQEQIENQYRPIKELRKIQFQRFKEILKHAYKNVNFYKKLYDSANVKPEDIQKLSDINKLPVVKKLELKQSGIDNITAGNISKGRWAENHTSGSTNIPFTVISDKNYDDQEHAAWLRELSIMNYSPGDKILRIRNHYDKRGNFLTTIFNRESHLSCDDIEKNVSKAYEKMVKFNPDFIETFSTSIIKIASFMINNDLKFKLKGIQIMGSPMDENQKKVIKKAFDTTVLKDYSSAEGMRIGYQCEKAKGYHIDITRFIIEIIRNKKPAKEDEKGEILITNLENWAMPLIRYRIKDCGIFTNKKCGCGRSFPIIKDIKGRLIEHIKTTDGKVLWLGMFNSIMNPEVKFINKFQIQYKDDKMIVLIKPTEFMNEKKLKEINNKIDDIYGDDLNFEVKIVDNIKSAESGKEILYKNENPTNLGGFD
ncbi:hypothetical protein GF327_01635 [Candidatus Woesearchaeota archaeon]|nr:hypothetical protein [Candidatus Woesearchaeota archaeon]